LDLTNRALCENLGTDEYRQRYLGDAVAPGHAF
jgi:hypothetical protein